MIELLASLLVAAAALAWVLEPLARRSPGREEGMEERDHDVPR